MGLGRVPVLMRPRLRPSFLVGQEGYVVVFYSKVASSYWDTVEEFPSTWGSPAMGPWGKVWHVGVEPW